MTTTVRILIEGNKACRVSLIAADAGQPDTVVMPGSFTTMMIHGEQAIQVIETGDFIA